MYAINICKSIKKHSVFVSLFLFFLFPAQVPAEETALQMQQQLIRDLIQDENQGLLKPEAMPTRAKTPISTKNINNEGPELILRALYGVGQRVVAEVSFRGESYLYLRGQAWPIGDYQGHSQLRLLSMSSRCIRLAHKEQHFDACVSP